LQAIKHKQIKLQTVMGCEQSTPVVVEYYDPEQFYYQNITTNSSAAQGHGQLETRPSPAALPTPPPPSQDTRSQAGTHFATATTDGGGMNHLDIITSSMIQEEELFGGEPGIADESAAMYYL
jgi:hypothetical protein